MMATILTALAVIAGIVVAAVVGWAVQLAFVSLLADAIEEAERRKGGDA